MAVTATELEKLVVRLMADNSRLSRGLRQAEGMVGQTVANITRLGIKMSMAVTAPLAIIGRVSAKEFGKFEDAMNKAFVVMGKVNADMKAAMTDQARTMATQTTQTAVELANAYRHLAASGMSATQSMSALPIVNDFAIAGMFELEHATTLLVDAQHALGLAVDDNVQNLKNLRSVANAITKAGIISTTDPQQIARALTTKAGAQLRVTGKSMEEGLAIISAMASRGVKAELAGEQLFMMLRDIQGAVLNNAAAWQKYGISVFEANGQMRHTADILENIETVFAKLPTEGKKKVLMDLGITERSVAATLNLIGASKEIRDFEEQIRNTGNLIGEMAAGNMASFNGQMKIMGNIITDVAISIGSILAPSLIQLNETLKQGVDWFNGLTRSQQEMLVHTAMVVAAIGPITLAVGTIGSVLFGVFSAAATVIGALVSPLGLVAAAMAGVAAWVYGTDGLVAGWDAMTAGLMTFGEKALGFFLNFQHNFEQLTTFVSNNWGGILSDIEQILRIWVSNAIDDFITAFEGMTRIAAVVFDYIFSVEFVAAVYEGLSKATEVITNWIMMIAKKFDRLYKAIMNPVGWAIDAAIGVGDDNDPAMQKFRQDIETRRTEGTGTAIKNIFKDTLGQMKGLSLEGFQGSRKYGAPLDFRFGFGDGRAGAGTPFDHVFAAINKDIEKFLAPHPFDPLFTAIQNGVKESMQFADNVMAIRAADAAKMQRDLIRQQGKYQYDMKTMQYVQVPIPRTMEESRGTADNSFGGRFGGVGGAEGAIGEDNPLRLFAGMGQTFREQEMLADKEKEMMEQAIESLKDIQSQGDKVASAKIKGSQEAAEATLKAMFGGMTAEEKAARAQIEELKNANKALRNIDENLKNTQLIEFANLG